MSQITPEQGVKVVVLDTPEQLIDHAKTILHDVKKPEWKDIPLDKVLEAFQDKYKEFGRIFPIVLRHIIQTKKLYTDVLKRYILLCKNHPTHSIEEFQERQADYMVMIYRKENPRCSSREISMVKKKYVDDLKKEEEYMKKVMDEVDKERKEKEAKYELDRREELKKLIAMCINDVPDDIKYNPSDPDNPPNSESPPKIQESGTQKTISSNDDDNDNQPSVDEDDHLVLLPESVRK